jgi:hypothetical protein
MAMGLHMPSLGELLCLLVALLLFAGLLVAILVPTLKGRNPSPPAFPVVMPDGPGRYRITGVVKETRADTTWLCEAHSADNAKVKAELEGIIVTRVEKM